MKRLTFIFLMIFSVLLLAACSDSASNSNSSPAPDTGTATETKDTVTLNFFHRWPNDPHNQYFKDVVEEFEKENPHIKIETEAVLNDSYKDKVRVLLGTSTNIPDVYFSWSGEFGHNFVRAEKALDLTPYLEEDTNWKDSFVETQMEPFSLNGKQYGAPWAMGGKAFFYNKDIFAELGLEVPNTWDEFIVVLDKITTTDYTPIAFGNKAPWAVSHYIGTLNQKLIDHDQRMTDYDQSTGEFTDPGYVEAMEKLNQLSPYFNESPNSLEHQFAREMFMNGQAAMAYLEMGETRLVEPGAGFEIGFFDFPTLDNEKGKEGYISGGPEGFMVSSTTEHPEEAVAFLKFLTSKEMGEKLLTDVGLFSAIKGTVNESNSSELQREAVDVILNAEGIALWLDTDINISVVDAYLSGAQLMLTGDKTPEDIINDVQQVAKSIK
ncbi:ABC transporter substrate-binding protein [Halalkalibacter alkalisediminis]|uniref:ABC transporter substrate-binding protein n=1 Tax=Halalkalibacter alkalisediminis TaxID=935616 RepID=A0ABV6NEF7_9BACI|nr:extracellular solute-binding protein [Halalkalibacter alkalisediminis]